MSKYIDADKFWKRLISVSENDWVGFDTIDEILSEMSAADVQEVRHGRLILIDTSTDYASIYKCSVCGQYLWIYHECAGEWHYCPNCGAKMDGHFEEPEINPCRGCEDYDGKGGCISNGGCGASMDGDAE